MPTFDPNRDRVQRRLYRTNPSIPRPESKYGTRSNVYEQIIELKKLKVADSKGNMREFFSRVGISLKTGL